MNDKLSNDYWLVCLYTYMNASRVRNNIYLSFISMDHQDISGQRRVGPNYILLKKKKKKKKTPLGRMKLAY